MSVLPSGADAALSRQRSASRAAMAAGFPPRPTLVSWPASGLSGVEVMGRLTSAPFAVAEPELRRKRGIGVELLLGWLGGQPGAPTRCIEAR